MPSAPARTDLLQQLESFGRPSELRDWAKRDPDYVARLGVTDADIPELLTIARYWADRTEWPQDRNDVSVFSSVHAWRALAQLGATEAIDLLVNMLDPLEADDDDLFLEEFPDAFALLGPAAVEPLCAVLADTERADFVHIAAAHGLQTIAQRHPDTRPDAIAALAAALTGNADDEGIRNGLVISYLMKLQAVEAGDAIERAFAEDRVDVQVAGNWSHVRQELGLEDHGLVPSELAEQKLGWARYLDSHGKRDDRDAYGPPLPPADPQSALRWPTEQEKRAAQRKADGRKRRKRKRRHGK